MVLSHSLIILPDDGRSISGNVTENIMIQDMINSESMVE